jgi:aminoglycoside 3-N-acetyltransferase
MAVPSRSEVIAATQTPGTVASLLEDLQALGLANGDTVIVHSSLSALGWIAGGPQAVVEALTHAVGPQGTIVMPTHTSELTDPVDWSNPPVPAEWVPTIRAEIPAFDRDLTQPQDMGKVVESFLMQPDVRRSNHPTVSFAARGPAAATIVDSHPLTPELGESSPLGRLYELDAKVLLLGVTHASNTSLHLAEYRASWPSKTNHQCGTPILVDGNRQWAIYEDIELSEDDFVAIGEAFADTGAEALGQVGIGTGRLYNQRALVDFATDWMSTNRI